MSLKKKVLTGTKWVALTNIFRQVLQIVSLFILARLLTPDDFGLFAILMLFVGFMQMFSDMGTGAALIQIKDPSEKLLSSVFFFNLFVGLLLCLLLISISGLIATFFGNPHIQELLQIISIIFIISSFGVVQKALYDKQMDFKKITLIESISQLIGLIFAIISAMKGLGIYSLIIQALSSNTIRVVLIWFYSNWRPLFHFTIEDITQIWDFTKNYTLFDTINYFARNADNFLIGKFLGSPALGVYSIAYRIMLYPLQNISRTLLRILFPAFAQIQDDNMKFQKAYLRVIFFIALISFPIMIGMMATADIFVPILFGDKWKNLDILIMILAPIGMIQSIITTTGSIYMAKGNTRTLLKIGIINSIVTVTFFIIGLPFGIKGVALFYVISNLIMLYPVLKLAWSQIELSVKRGIFEIFPILLLSIIMGFIVVFLGKIFNIFYHNEYLQLIIMILGGIIVYYLLIRLKYGDIRTILSELKK